MTDTTIPNNPAERQPTTPWRTVGQAADRVMVHPKLIYGEIKAGRLRAAVVGGRRVIRLRDEWIDAWLEASATPIEVRK